MGQHERARAPPSAGIDRAGGSTIYRFTANRGLIMRRTRDLPDCDHAVIAPSMPRARQIIPPIMYSRPGLPRHGKRLTKLVPRRVLPIGTG